METIKSEIGINVSFSIAWVSKAKLNLINFSPLEPVAPGPDENSVGE